MKNQKLLKFSSPMGKQEKDSSGSPVGVVRMNVTESYSDVCELLQNFINNSDQESWNNIKAKIDYTYKYLDYALSPLDQTVFLIHQIKEKLEKGQKLLFKPNLVAPVCIDPETHGPALGSNACTDWTFIAALMRWFHDKGGISYYEMSIGEAGTTMTSAASLLSKINPEKKQITPEAVLEGKCGDFYGGWGFYFVRKYLAESLTEGEGDNPFMGYEESINGTYIPPGLVSDKLMVYDLNRIYDDPSKGRECEIPDGVNYKSIVLHKVITGGDLDDPEDRNAYPGSVLINVPKFKIHVIALFTNVIKNLGIGLYPMQYASKGDYKWEYGGPHDTTIVGMKSGIPHQVWVPEIDRETSLPKKNAEGNYILKKTGGIVASMIDIIKAVDNLGILMIHIVDGIEAINIIHDGAGLKTPEGMVFAGLDPVATDLLCARYMFSNVPLKESLEVKLEGGTAGGFPQKVPIPIKDGNNIISTIGYDCPLARDITFESAEKRGLGQTSYHVIGYDILTDSPMVSLKGHLGSVKNDTFSDVITTTLYYDIFKVPWDLQRTSLNYLAAVDELEGTKLKEEILQYYDENDDGVISYNEFGKRGSATVSMHFTGDFVSLNGKEELGYLKGYFKLMSTIYRYRDKQNNLDNHDIMAERYLVTACNTAFAISQAPTDIPDPFVPGLTCGNGKWPSIQFVRFFQTGSSIFGPTFPNSITFPGFYSNALFYADLTQNAGKYAGKLRSHPDLQAVSRYISDVGRNKIDPLDFVIYVPAGFDTLSGAKIPNIEVTDAPSKIFTASFQNGKEIWS
ncbi:MAG: DUF362 domain-containing protein [Candidatus Lokiarchaeota archaeon]|nr:DUF362 domain-containing protein [Candidatus Lokiarchaeota archaeon]